MSLWWHKLGVIINTASDAADLIVPLFASASEEKVVAAHLDAGRRLIELIESGVGGTDEIELPVRAIIADALRLEAVGLIVAHNHPSGDSMPSDADLSATRILASTAANVGIRLHDHIIVAGGECRSLRALGLL